MTDLCQTFPNAWIAPARESIELISKNSTVLSLLWFKGGEKTESGLLQTLRPKLDNTPLSLARPYPVSWLPPRLWVPRGSVHQGEALAENRPAATGAADLGGQSWRKGGSSSGYPSSPAPSPQHSPPPDPLPPRQVTWLGSLVLLLLAPSSLLLGSGSPFRVTGLPSAASLCQGCGKRSPQMELGPCPARLPPGRNWRACWYGRQGGAAATLLLDA